MSTKYTPGPWLINKTGQQYLGLLTINASGDGTHVCQVTTDTRGSRHKISDEQIANARLIAAAPDLLEALERQVSNVKQWLDGGPPADADESRAIYEQMCAAVRKATGAEA